MSKKGNIQLYNDYLLSCVKMPYVWGGQHTKLTPENYVQIIEKKEAGRGCYADGQTYAEAAIEYCKKMFAQGYTVLYAYDCSGLAMHWLQDVMHILKSDTNANGLWHHCEDAEEPKNGYWVFRVKDPSKPRKSQVASHIGFCVEIDGKIHVIHAKGRKYGVVNELWKETKRYWHHIGIPDCMDFSAAQEDQEPEPVEEQAHNTSEPVQEAIQEPQEPHSLPGEVYVCVIGGQNRRVNIRRKGTVMSKHLGTARGGDYFRLLGYADSGWYRIDYNGDTDAYITNKPRYTRIFDAEALQ